MSNLTVDEDFGAITAAATAVWSGIPGEGIEWTTTIINTTSTINYDVDTDSFEISFSDSGIEFHETFSPNEIRGPDFYEDANGNRFFIIGRKEYLTLGVWTEPATGQAGVPWDVGSVIFGIHTLLANMPTTGSANYGVLVDGGFTVTATGEQNDLRGIMTMTTNFGTGVMSGTANLSWDPTGDNGSGSVVVQQSWNEVNFSANIAGNTFSGTTGTVDNTMNGVMDGMFFGPAAAEIGGFWSLTGDGMTAGGHLPGDRQ